MSGSATPPKYLASAEVKAGSSGAARANRVMLERNFMSSGEPKTASAERPVSPFTAAVQA